MYFAFFCQDKPDSLNKRKTVRLDHLARLEKLQQQGRLLIAGPHPAEATSEPGEAGFTGSLVVADFDSHEAARNWADADPYMAAGVYERVDIKPFINVNFS